MYSKQMSTTVWRRLTIGVAACLLGTFLPCVAGGEDGRWVWGRNNRRNQKYASGGIDDGLIGGGGGGVLGGDGVHFGLSQEGFRPGGVGGYRPGYPRPPPVHEGPEPGFGVAGGQSPTRPPVLAGPGGPSYGGQGIGGPGIGGPGFGGPGFGGPGLGGLGIDGPGIGGPGIGGPEFDGPGNGGPGGFGGHGGPGGRPGILTGPVPSWEQERLDAQGIGHRYHSFDTCKCVHSFNCKSPGITFGKCDKDKQYCCNGIRPGSVGHGVRKPHFGEGYPPPGPEGFGPGPIGDPGFGPQQYPGGLGYDRSAKVKKV